MQTSLLSKSQKVNSVKRKGKQPPDKQGSEILTQNKATATSNSQNICGLTWLIVSANSTEKHNSTVTEWEKAKICKPTKCTSRLGLQNGHVCEKLNLQPASRSAAFGIRSPFLKLMSMRRNVYLSTHVMGPRQMTSVNKMSPAYGGFMSPSNRTG